MIRDNLDYAVTIAAIIILALALLLMARMDAPSDTRYITAPDGMRCMVYKDKAMACDWSSADLYGRAEP